MKRTILVCDCCKLPVPAVKTVDLCEMHAGVLAKLRERRQQKPKKIKTPWNKADYDTIVPRIMEIAESRPMFTAALVCKVLKIKPHIAKVAVAKLIHAGKIDSTGNGAGRKLSKAS